MTRAIPILFLALVAGCGGGSEMPSPAPRPSDTPPNLVLFTVDTLRADHLGVYGYDRPTSPNLDLFAAEAAVFEQAWSPRGLTWPSLTTLLTGLEIHAHGVRRNGEMPRQALTTLATVLSERGYRTGAFLANACEADLPGFDERECTVSDELRQYRWDLQATRASLEFLQAGGGPFFLWVHLMEPHTPYNCTEPTKPLFDPGYTGDLEVTRENMLEVTDGSREITDEDRQHILNLYDCGVRHADDRLGEVLLALDRLNLSRDTLVAFTSDHGEELGDHQDYWFHTGSVYEGVLRVPLLIRHPRGTGAGRRVEQPVGLVDLAPTLLDLMGLDPSLLGPGVAGRSVAPLVAGEEVEPRPLRGEIEDDVVVLRDGALKYVWNIAGEPIVIEPLEENARSMSILEEGLFDLDADPREQTNLLESRPADREAMRALAAELMGEAGWPHEGQEIDPEIRRRLIELGYVVN